jgi:Na+/H+ antiporter
VPEAPTFIGLLVAIALLAEVARALGVPHPVLLVLGGLALGLVPGLPAPRLDPDTFFFVFLPPLLYSEALRFSTDDLRRHATEISLLAVGLVVCTTVAVAAVAHVVAGLPWASAFVLGAVVGPTDPITATAVIQRLGVSERIVTILEGEALVNDGTALVTLKLAVAAAGGAALSAPQAAAQVVWVVLGGALVGTAVVRVWAWARRWVRVVEVEITLSVAMPFAAYAPAEALGVSGVLATVTAGLLVGRWYDVVPARARLLGHGFWEVLSFLLNSTLFLLVGLTFPDVLARIGGRGAGTLLADAVAVAGTVVALRLLWMFVMPRIIDVLERRAEAPRPAVGELLVLGLSGMRGGVSLAAALSVPIVVDGRPFPGRDEIIFLTYMVLLTTLVVPGLLLAPLIERAGIGTGEDRAVAKARARHHILQAALEHLDELLLSDEVPEEIVERLRTLYETRADRLGWPVTPVTADGAGSQALQRADSGALEAQRRALADLETSQLVGARTARELERELDLGDRELIGAGR